METSNQLPEDDRDPISEIMDALRSFVGVLEKRKWFAVGVLVATVGASLVVTMRQTPIYEASATIQIDRRSPAVLNRSQEVIELGTSDYWSIKEYMQTQVEVLKSRRLARRVVDKLSLGIDEKFYGLDRVKPPLSEEMKRKIIAASDPAAVLVGKLSVEVRDESQIVTVKVLDPDPHMAQDLANAVVSEYQDENLEYKKRVVTDAISELRNMLARLRSEKEDAEARVLEFERRYALGSLENRKGIVRERLRMLHDAYVKAGIARTEAEASQKRIEVAGRIAQVEALLAQKDLSRVAHPVLVADGTVSTLKLRLVELDNTVAEMEARYLPKMPAMKAAYSQRSQVREALQRQCRLLLESDLIRLNGELEESNDALKRAIQIEDDLRASLDLAREEEAALVKLELDYKPLLKKKTELDGYFEEVNRRYTETNLSAQVETNNVRIQDTAALPTAPVKPNRKLNLIVGLVLGLVLGIGCALLVESLDATLKTREDIEAVANIEFFGLIPAIPDIEQPDGEGPHNRPELVAFHNPKSSVAEHFRTAKTNLFFSGSGKRPKVILVTSPGAREGKTTVVSNLATVTAAAGATCILVDADMRRPRVHRLLSLPRRPGTAEYFVSTHPVETFIKASGVPGLDVLTCGSISSNPVEILESPKFRSTLARLAETYDVVFVDTPPVLAVSDAKILCPMVDAAVLVVRAGQTMRDALREARRMLSPVASTSLGVILNCFDIEKHSYRYYYYRSKKYGYYNYHYAYSEGETESEGATGKSRTGSSGSDKGSKWAGP